jgi:hypothetical protein
LLAEDGDRAPIKRLLLSAKFEPTSHRLPAVVKKQPVTNPFEAWPTHITAVSVDASDTKVKMKVVSS